MINIHKTAIVDDGAKIEDGVTIGAFSIIGANVTIGENTIISSHCVIDGITTIGNNNRIFSHCVLGTIPQDLKYNNEPTELIIGNNNTIREFAFINKGTAGGGNKTIIGDDCLIMGHVHIGHDCIVQNNIVIANSSILAGHVEINSNVVVGGASAIHQFCKIGDGAMIGGGSILVQDIPPFCICEGNRATLRGLNIIGLRRRFSSNRETIDNIKDAYKHIFEKNKNIIEQSQEIYQSTTNKHTKDFAKFIIDTKRGIPFVRKRENEKTNL